MVLGGAAEHATPAGITRRMSLRVATVFARHFTVYMTSRKPGLAPGCTMAGLAADVAEAIEEDLASRSRSTAPRPGVRSGCSSRSATRT
jgi:hypothetical protein